MNRCEFKLKAKDGSWVWYAYYGKIMHSSNYKHGKRFIGVTFNINNKKCQENELRRINLKLLELNLWHIPADRSILVRGLREKCFTRISRRNFD